jgi:hypothetical protein
MSLPDPAPADGSRQHNAAQPTDPEAPVSESCWTLDALRGFALLGILLMNILGFGLLSRPTPMAGLRRGSPGGRNRTIWMGPGGAVWRGQHARPVRAAVRRRRGPVHHRFHRPAAPRCTTGACCSCCCSACSTPTCCCGPAISWCATRSAARCSTPCATGERAYLLLLALLITLLSSLSYAGLQWLPGSTPEGRGGYGRGESRPVGARARRSWNPPPPGRSSVPTT